jgi:hypothetical protein
MINNLDHIVSAPVYDSQVCFVFLCINKKRDSPSLPFLFFGLGSKKMKMILVVVIILWAIESCAAGQPYIITQHFSDPKCSTPAIFTFGVASPSCVETPCGPSATIPSLYSSYTCEPSISPAENTLIIDYYVVTKDSLGPPQYVYYFPTNTCIPTPSLLGFVDEGIMQTPMQPSSSTLMGTYSMTTCSVENSVWAVNYYFDPQCSTLNPFVTPNGGPMGWQPNSPSSKAYCTTF